MDFRRLRSACAALLLAAAWTPSASALPITDNAADDTSAHADVDAAGNVHVVYVRGGTVYYQAKTAAGIGPEETVGTGSSPAISVGPDNVPHVAYVSSGAALVTSRAGGVWQPPQTAVAGGVGLLDLDVAPDGSLHLGLSGSLGGSSGRDIAYATDAGGTFSAVLLVGSWFEGWPMYCGEYAYTPDVEVDAAGNWYVAFRYAMPGSGCGAWSALRIRTGNPAWASADVSGATYNINNHGFAKGAFAVDAAGRAHAVHTASGRCYHAVADGSTWTDQDLGPCSEPALSVDAAGAVHVAFRGASGELVYLRDDGAGFSPAATLAPAGSLPAVAGEGEVFFQAGTDLEVNHLVPGGALAATPASHDFGATPVGGSATRTFTLENGAGGRPVLLGLPSIGGAGAARFSIASNGCSGRNLGAGESCTFEVRFSPSAVPAVSATLSFPSSDPAFSPGAIGLSGEGMPCSYGISPSVAAAGAAGESGTVTVTTSDPACTWSAASDDPWLAVDSGASGTGDGTVGYTVGANAGPARSGTLTIAGRTFTVDQGDGCSISISPASAPAPAAGGAGTVTVAASDPACGWTAASDDPWLTVDSGASGTGDGTVGYTAGPNAGLARSGTLTIAGQTFTVDQADGCSFSISPASATVGAAASSGTVTVTASDAACSWTAASGAGWITSGAGLTGTGSLAYDVAANPGLARSGSLTIAGQTFTVDQADGCSFSISPASATVGAAASSGTVTVTASDAACGWTAASGAGWITSGAGLTGTGSLAYDVAANPGLARRGSLTIAGQTFTVDQADGCSFSISPASAPAGAAGGSGTVAVDASDAACGWTAASGTGWITVDSGASGTGDGTVGYSAGSNLGPARSGTLTVAGRTFTVDQADGCTFSVSPSSAPAAAAGGTGSVTVSASHATCTWTAASGAGWIAVGAGGTGDGLASYTVAANPGLARSGTVTVAGEPFTVDQADGCAFTISPSSAVATAAGGSLPVTVTASDAACPRAASSLSSWITIDSGASGTGSGTVSLTVGPNAGPERDGTAQIAGATFPVAQASGCSFALSASGVSVGAGGQSGTVTVTTSAPTCGWTAASGASWISIDSGASGAGDGTIGYTVAASAGAERSAVLTFAGQAFTVDQADGCSFSVSPSSAPAAAAGGTGSVTVSASDATCAWDARSDTAWIGLDGVAGGTGSGTLGYTVAANAGLPRSGAFTVAGESFTVDQADGCSFTLSPAGASVGAAGESGTVTVHASDPACAWTALSDAAWITIDSGATGTGDGAVGYTVAANEGAARAGSLDVGGTSFPVEQAEVPGEEPGDTGGCGCGTGGAGLEVLFFAAAALLRPRRRK